MALAEDDDSDSEAVNIGRLTGLVSGLDDADRERVDPPGDLWDRIATAVRAEPIPEHVPARTVLEYWIDADDVVTAVDDDWAGWARENDAPELVAPAPERTLWSYFDGDEVRELWRILVGRARATGSEARVPLRCDGPDTRRWFEMTITPEPADRVRFRSALVFEEPRPRLSLVGRRTERDRSLPAVALCSWCGRGHDGSRWIPIDQLAHERRLLEQTSMPPVSHGICPRCREAMSAEARRLVPEGTGEMR